MAVIIPQDYQGKSKEEIYKDLDTIAQAYMKQKRVVEDLQAEIKLRDSQLQLQRGDIVKLKSMIGHKNIEIKNLKLDSDNIIDIASFETIERNGRTEKIYK